VVLGGLERTQEGCVAGGNCSHPSEYTRLRAGYMAGEGRVERSQFGQVGSARTQNIDAPRNLDRFALSEEQRFMLRVDERTLELVRCPAGMFGIARKSPKIIGENDRQILGESMG
jgi:hypothetical protein